MKKLLSYLSVILLFPSYVLAGVVTHSDYVSGNTITAAGQNANENLIFNEFNGNIDNANIKAGGIVASNIANATITTTQIAAGTIADTNLTAVLQSSMTIWNGYANYRRPHVVWISTSAVAVEGNTGTANETCIVFPDGNKRCVTEALGASTQRRAAYNDTLSLVSTYSGGMPTGDPLINNSYRYAYMVKATDNVNKMLLALSSSAPVVGMYTSLNSAFNPNGWVYIGTVRYGDNGTTATGFLSFYQTGGYTMFTNLTTGGNACGTKGLILATTAGATSLTYTRSGSSSNLIPDSGMVYMTNVVACTALSTSLRVTNGSSIDMYRIAALSSATTLVAAIPAGLSSSDTITVVGSGTNASDIYLSGFYDNVFGVGINPQL